MSDMKTYSGALHGLCVASQVLKQGTARTAATGGATFAGCLSLCRTVTRTTTVVTKTVAVSTSAMTMEEFQSYIWDKIDSFPFHATRPYDEESIKISDKCWQRMKDDPEYEEKMMNIIKEGRDYPDPFFGLGSSGSYCVLEFDGGEGCHSHTWSKNFGGSKATARQQYEEESEHSFWRSRQRRREQQKIDEARYLARRQETQLGRQRAWQVRLAARGEYVPLPVGGTPAAALAQLM